MKNLELYKCDGCYKYNAYIFVPTDQGHKKFCLGCEKKYFSQPLANKKNKFMRWINFRSKKPPKNLPFFAKGNGGCRCLCTPLGREIHITDCEQRQYIFDEGEEIEIRGQKLVYWLDEDIEEG